ncbi:TPA: hypothetical protein OXO44_003943 [Acinetobacter baumannii]|uniref:Uncharacterized protein n=1 Tax=Acinetobacter baumannii TaxID=470 RepID=A0A646LZP6_ACIBA|nr:hypothetical protein [Acinetobacter baumannii]EKA78396.1 hypothetical protein ACINIS58_A0068 [Acinetobacter baumannii IS-58]EKK06737.1 hypothetical protein ACINIS235_A0099 [Acinetobacter baumannii IS-235]EKT8680436.1 hypothetical protein [Acinetobacter baumannii]EKU0974887.1 hypothetical protein [Acinetobacter baumannii]EKW2952853.1 hypothetical protein [Acinetobacter baumannii]
MKNALTILLMVVVFNFFLFGSFHLFKGTFKVEIMSTFQILSFMYVLLASSTAFTALTFYIIKLLKSNNQTRLLTLGFIVINIAINFYVIKSI